VKISAVCGFRVCRDLTYNGQYLPFFTPEGHDQSDFTQVVLTPVDMGFLTLSTIYMNGMKMESRANHYRFVW
jgi:hypothetical protein